MKGIRKFCAKFFSSIKYEVFLGIALINLVVLLLFFAAASYSTHRFFISDRTESARILNAQEALLIENLIRDVDKHIMNLYFRMMSGLCFGIAAQAVPNILTAIIR